MYIYELQFSKVLFVLPALTPREKNKLQYTREEISFVKMPCRYMVTL